MSDDGPTGCTITFACDAWQHDVSDAAAIEQAVAAALAVTDAKADSPVELAIVLADDAFVRAHNRDYRGKDQPTNVLAFAQLDSRPGGGAPPMPAGAPVELGDVMVAHETVLREAAAAGISVEQHLLHLVVHGVLHLLGHDHQADQEAAEMQRLEVAALAALGIPDPYATATVTAGEQ